VHHNGILHTMRVPGCIAPGVAELAIGMAQRVAGLRRWARRGFFLRHRRSIVHQRDGAASAQQWALHTDACAISQFEQQVRALCGLSQGSTRLLSPANMLNLLGDMWGRQPARQGVCEALILIR